jgi:hypothetical protein
MRQQLGEYRTLYTDVPVTRSGIFQYSGASIDSSLDPYQIYNVYRPASEIGAINVLDAIKLLPISDDHVNSELALTNNICGSTGQKVYYNDVDGTVRADLAIADPNLINKIQMGKKQLSIGMGCEYEFAAGEFDGVKYDFIQKSLTPFHLAVVDVGRAGSQVALDQAVKVGEVYESIALDVADVFLNQEENRMTDQEVIAELKSRIAELESQLASSSAVDQATETELAKDMVEVEVEPVGESEVMPEVQNELVAEVADVLEASEAIKEMVAEKTVAVDAAEIALQVEAETERKINLVKIAKDVGILVTAQGKTYTQVVKDVATKAGISGLSAVEAFIKGKLSVQQQATKPALAMDSAEEIKEDHSDFLNELKKLDRERV